MADPADDRGDWTSQLPTSPGEDPNTEYLQSPANGQWYLVPKMPADYQPYTAPAPPPEGPSWLDKQWESFKANLVPFPEALHESDLANVARTADRIVGEDNTTGRVARSVVSHHPLLQGLMAASKLITDRRSLIPETDEEIARNEAQPQGFNPSVPTLEGVEEGLKAVPGKVADFARGAVTDPGGTLGGLVGSLEKSPELLLMPEAPGLATSRVAMNAARAAKAGRAAEITAMALGKVAGDTTTLGALLAGSEAVREFGNTGQLDPEKITETAGSGALLGAPLSYLTHSILKPTVRSILEGLQKSRTASGGAPPGESAGALEGPPGASPDEGGGSGGATFDNETGEPVRAAGALPKPAVSYSLGELVQRAQDAGVDHEEMQPIMSAVLRKQIEETDAKQQIGELINNAASVAAAKKPKTPAPKESVAPTGGASGAAVAGTNQAKSETPTNTATDLRDAFASLKGNGATEDLRNKLWAAHVAGKDTVAGVKDPVLAAARKAGIGTTDRAAFDTFMDNYGKEPANAAKPTPDDRSGDSGVREGQSAVAQSEPAEAPAPIPDERGVVQTTVADQPVAVNVQPTELQKASGNYQKGHIEVQGIPITIENPKGTERSGVSPAGEPWTATLKHDYGYIKRTVGGDGEQVDTFIGPHPHDASQVYVIDQHRPGGGDFDEHKAMVGFDSRKQALEAYRSNYPAGHDGARAVTAMPINQFKEWLASGHTREASVEAAPTVREKLEAVKSVEAPPAGTRPDKIELVSGAPEPDRYEAPKEQAATPAPPAEQPPAQAPGETDEERPTPQALAFQGETEEEAVARHAEHKQRMAELDQELKDSAPIEGTVTTRSLVRPKGWAGNSAEISTHQRSGDKLWSYNHSYMLPEQGMSGGGPYRSGFKTEAEAFEHARAAIRKAMEPRNSIEEKNETARTKIEKKRINKWLDQQTPSEKHNERPEEDLSDNEIAAKDIDLNEMPYPHQWKESMDAQVSRYIHSSGKEGVSEVDVLKSLGLSEGPDDPNSIEYKRYLAASEAFERALDAADKGEHGYEMVPDKPMAVRIKTTTVGEQLKATKAKKEAAKAPVAEPAQEEAPLVDFDTELQKHKDFTFNLSRMHDAIRELAGIKKHDAPGFDWSDRTARARIDRWLQKNIPDLKGKSEETRFKNFGKFLQALYYAAEKEAGELGMQPEHHLSSWLGYRAAMEGATDPKRVLTAITALRDARYQISAGRQMAREEAARAPETPAAEPGAPTADESDQTDIAPEHAELLSKIKQKTIRFASGMSRKGDIMAGVQGTAGDPRMGIGVDVGELSSLGLLHVAERVANIGAQVFVDSGAFSLFKRGIKNEGGVEAMDFDAILKHYDQIEAHREEEDAAEERKGKLFFVMPDVVGDQAASLALVDRYKDWMAGEANRDLVGLIIPIQKGELSLAQAYRQVVQMNGDDDFIVGIPSNSKAVSDAELAQFLKQAQPEKIHFLGAVSDKLLNPKLAAIAAAGLDPSHVSADGNLLRSQLYGKQPEGVTRPEAVSSTLQEAGKKFARGSGNLPADTQELLRDVHVRSELVRMSEHAGWGQIGGRMIRKTEDFNHPDYNVITGRTTWEPKEEWFRDIPKLPKGDRSYQAVVADALAGKPLKAREIRVVEAMVEEAAKAVHGAAPGEESMGEEEAVKQGIAEEAEHRTKADLEAYDAHLEQLYDEAESEIDALASRDADHPLEAGPETERSETAQAPARAEDERDRGPAAETATAERPAPRGTGPRDLFGDDTRVAQELADETRRRDLARNSGQESLETGRPDDMFSQATHQVDLMDEVAPPKGLGVQSDHGTGASPSAEPDRLEPEAQDAGRAAPVRNERSTEEARPGQAVSSAEEAGLQPHGRSELSGPSPAYGGERGDQPVRTAAERPEPSFAPAGDLFAGGSPESSEPDAADVQAGEAAAGETVEQADAHQSLSYQREAKLAAQLAAEPIRVDYADGRNIADTLPFLLPQQHEDVLFAEKRLAKPEGYGVLFTNGTGTGKTFVGVGAIKRMVKMGKSNGLIVVPSQKIANDWVRSARNLGLTITPLTGINDPGKGVAITTYANLNENETLADRPHDFVVADEAHALMQNAAAGATGALMKLRALTMHPEGASTRAQMIHRKEHRELEELNRQAREYRYPQAPPPELQSKMDDAQRLWNQLQSNVRKNVDSMQGAKRPRAIFLSATPFAYEKNVSWAEGYLFNYPKVEESSAYNTPSPYDAFMIQHFGYRMRYGKLTQPGPEVDGALMQRQFNMWLRKEGALAARMLDVDKDYDRKFVLVASKIGTAIDEGLDYLREHQGGKYRSLYEMISKKFDFLQRSRLLEALKAREAIPYIKQQLKLGRKVVVFYDFNEGGGQNIFDIKPISLTDGGMISDPATRKLAQLINEFRAERSDLVKLDTTAHSPLIALKAAFPQALEYNGLISAKRRIGFIDAFNDDDSPQANLVLAQKAANVGWSAHDTTGKHPRVLVNLGLPTAPTVAIQQEGRIYRVGQASDAMFRYFNTGTNWERAAFATTIANRASTAENLAMGDQARGLKDAFIEAFQNSDVDVPGSAEDGKGGKVSDRSIVEATSDFDKARSFYFGQQKKNSRTKSAEGTDYYATPEPLGLKMVEWGGVRPTDELLEPSAGHGAIARWFPESNRRTVIEPSLELASRLGLVTDAKLINERFEQLHAVNKFDVITMNPPFGVGGKTAIEHLSLAASHLRDGGRIVALIPEGPAADAKFDKWMDSDDAKGVYQVAEYGLPQVAFERAGTSVKARIVVLDKLSQEAQDAGARITEKSRKDIEADDIKAFFNKIRDLEAPARPVIPVQTRSMTNQEALRSYTGGPMPSRPAVLGARFESFDTEHTRTGKPVFYASPTSRVGGAEFALWKNSAKKWGGYYSAFKVAGAKPGFIFKSAEARDQFIAQESAAPPAASYLARRGAPRETLTLRQQMNPDVHDYLKKVAEALKGRATVMVHGRPSDFGRHIGQDVANDIYGVYTDENNTLHFIANNIHSVAEAQLVLRHEAFGHMAMEKFPEFRKALEMVVKLQKAGGKRINELWNEVAKQYPEGLSLARQAKEVIALMVERGMKNAIVDRAVTGVHQLLQNLGIPAQPNEAELARMILQAARGLPVEAQKLAGIDRMVAFDVEKYLQAGKDGKAQDAMGRILPESEAIDALAYARRHNDMHAVQVLKDISADLPEDASTSSAPDEEDAFHPAEGAIPKGVLFMRHAPMDPDAKAAKDKVMPGDGRDNLSLRDRIRLSLKALTNFDGLAVLQNWVDDQASLERYERMLNNKVLKPGEISPLKAARSVRNLASQMAAALEKGIPEYRDGAFHVVPGRKSINQILAPLHENASGSLVTHLELYVAALRASRLIKERNRDGTAREKNFTQVQIDAALKLGDTYPELKKVAADLQEMFGQLLDLGEKAGTIDPAARAIYGRHFYVPFYRLEGLLNGERQQTGRARGGIANQREMSGHLSGKAAPLNNILENILMNVANQLDAAQKAIAMQKVADAYQGVFMHKEAKPIEAVKVSNEQIERAMKALGITFDPQMTDEQREAWTTFFRRVAPTDHDVVRVMRKGKPEYHRVTDPLVLEAITALQGSPKWLRDLDKKMFGLLSGPKRLYTAMVTATPMYTARRFVRVMMDTWMQSNHKLGLVKNAYKDFYDSIKGHPDLYDMMMAGSGGAQGYDSDPERVRDMLINSFKDGNKHNFVLKAASPKTWWRTWCAIQRASKNEHMLRVYRAARASGQSVAEAAFRARDIEDLSMHGGGAIMQFINRTVPFLNPRIQGTYRMVRGFKDNWKAYAIRGAAVMMGTLALQAINFNNPRYQELPQWQKDVAWHVFVGDHHFLLPKPFELGLIFATVPERIVAASVHALDGKGGDTLGQSLDALKRAVLDTFALNPIPQVLRPFVEQATNTDAFGNAIVRGTMEKVEPQEQYNAFTSTTVRAIAGAMPGSFNYVLNSPARLEALIQSITGTLGLNIVQGADRLTRLGLGYGDAPSSSVLQSSVSSFYQYGEPHTTKYTEELYDFMDQSDKAFESVTQLAKDGRLEQAQKKFQSKERIIELRNALNGFGKEMRDLTKQEVAVMHSPDMSAADKEAALKVLTKQRNDIARQVAPFEDFF